MSDLSNQMDNLATAMIVEEEPGAGLIQSTMRKAAAETRKLEADNAKLREWGEGNKREAGKYFKMYEVALTEKVNLKAENAKLREYVTHHPCCGRYNYGDGLLHLPCTCGLDALDGKDAT